MFGGSGFYLFPDVLSGKRTADFHVQHRDILMPYGMVGEFGRYAKKKEELLLVDENALVYDHGNLPPRRCFSILLIHGQAQFLHPVLHGIVARQLAALITENLTEDIQYLDHGPQAAVGTDIDKDTQLYDQERISMSGNRIEINASCSFVKVILCTSFFLSSALASFKSALSLFFESLSLFFEALSLAFEALSCLFSSDSDLFSSRRRLSSSCRASFSDFESDFSLVLVL